jgi:1-acyl-sn-glycerol-3-phosphate acyltransferase
MSQFALLRQRRFGPLFWTQFLGAANDSLFKFAFTLLATYHAADWGGLDPGMAGFVIGGIFILPFLLFSATAGQLADQLDKAWIMRRVKELEIAIMAIAAVAFATHTGWLLYLCVFLMGVHSTLFGPAKYAYLPQHLDERELTGGNGMVEMGTFVAILGGTIAGGLLEEGAVVNISIACLGIALAGRACAQLIPPTPPAAAGGRMNLNPFTETARSLALAWPNRTVFNSLLGISWLWFFGSIFLTSFTPFAHDVLGGDERVVTMLLATFSIGIGAGSLACEKLSGGKVEIGLVPFGSIGMTVFAVDLWLASRGVHHSMGRVMVDLFLLAFFGGLYSVPLYALIQARTAASHRARIIAANNILNAAFMVVASLMALALLKAGLTLPQLYLVVGVMNAAVAAYIFLLVPEFLMRFLCWLLIHSVYRLEKRGVDNIPEKGPAVLICNHVSFVDPLVIMAASPRPIRFVMDHRIFATPVLSWVFRQGKAIPIAPAKEDEQLMNAAFEEVARALEAGELVCIFPEGRITDTGELYPFRPGIRRVLDRTPVPVIPLALKGLWGSFFSRRHGRAMSNLRALSPFRRIALEGAPAIAAPDVTPERLQVEVQTMMGGRT